MKKLATLLFIGLTFSSINSHAYCPEGSFRIQDYRIDLDSDLVRSRILNNFAADGRLFLYPRVKFSLRVDTFRAGYESDNIYKTMKYFSIPTDFVFHGVGSGCSWKKLGDCDYSDYTQKIVMNDGLFFDFFVDKGRDVIIGEDERIQVTSFSEVRIDDNRKDYAYIFKFRTRSHNKIHSVLGDWNSLLRDKHNRPLEICVKE